MRFIITTLLICFCAVYAQELTKEEFFSKCKTEVDEFQDSKTYRSHIVRTNNHNWYRFFGHKDGQGDSEIFLIYGERVNKFIIFQLEKVIDEEKNILISEILNSDFDMKSVPASTKISFAVHLPRYLFDGKPDEPDEFKMKAYCEHDNIIISIPKQRAKWFKEYIENN